MPRSNETQIRTVLAVLGLIRRQYPKYKNDQIQTLRRNAIMNFSQTELEKGRFTTIKSGVNSIQSACTRGLNIKADEFDNLVEKWLSKGSNKLESVLVNLSPKIESEIRQFFNLYFLLT